MVVYLTVCIGLWVSVGALLMVVYLDSMYWSLGKCRGTVDGRLP